MSKEYTLNEKWEFDSGVIAIEPAKPEESKVIDDGLQKEGKQAT